MDFAVGSEAWIVPGFSGSSLIAIKIKLYGINHEGNYFVDEPIERAIKKNELLHSRVEAYRVLRYRMLRHFADAKIIDDPEDYDLVRYTRSTLFKFRIYQLNLVRYILEQQHSSKIHSTSFALTDKKRDKDWFVINDICEDEVDAIVVHN